MGLDGDNGFDMRMRVIALKLEVLILEVKDTLDIRVDDHPW